VSFMRDMWCEYPRHPFGHLERMLGLQLRNRAGPEWMLAQGKEKMPRDPTLREKFDTTRFADNKAEVIDLIYRLSHVYLINYQ